MTVVVVNVQVRDSNLMRNKSWQSGKGGDHRATCPEFFTSCSQRATCQPPTEAMSEDAVSLLITFPLL